MISASDKRKSSSDGAAGQGLGAAAGWRLGGGRARGGCDWRGGRGCLAPARGQPSGGLVSASDKRKSSSDGEGGRGLGSAAGGPGQRGWFANPW
ncbi:hypothetical protein GCM10027440_54030 [Nocardiopsis coralliicola]